MAVVFLADGFKEAVNFWVLVTYDVELFWVGLGGVPDLELVVVEAECPSEDDGIEVGFIDEVSEEDGPFVGFDPGFDANFSQVVLDERGDVAADFVSAVCDECEGEAVAIFGEDAVGAGEPSFFGEELAGFLRVVFDGLDGGVEKPHLGCEDACALGATAVKDEFQHLRDVDCVGEGAADFEVIEWFSPQVPADVGVGVSWHGEELEAGVVLEGANGPGVNCPEIGLTGFEGESEGELVAEVVEYDGIEPGGWGEVVVWVAGDADELVCFPLSEAEGTGSDGFAVVVCDPPRLVFAVEDMGWEDGDHPACECR